LGLKKQIVVTYSAIQKNILDYIADKKTIQKKETIVFIGNIKKHKGLIILLDAFHSAKEEGLPHKLLIIGSKENFRSKDNTIIKKIENTKDVSFTGFIADETLIQELAEASLLVQPSLYEGFCRILRYSV
jgi:glycosyltransferase involved in cell wall biosynthesis